MKLILLFLLSVVQLSFHAQNDSVENYTLLKTDTLKEENILINSIQFLNENPATAGMYNRGRFQALYQTNLNDFPVRTCYFAYDATIDHYNNWGIGLYSNRENFNNTINFKQIGIKLNRKIKIKKHVTTIGLGTAFYNYSFDWNNASFGDMIDPRHGFIYPTGDVPRGGRSTNISLHFGLTHNYKGLRIGTSILNLNRPYNSVLNGSSFIPVVINFNASYTFKLDQFDLTPIYNITRNSMYDSHELSAMIQYQNKYFAAGGIKLNNNGYFIKAGALIKRFLYTNINYSISPRLLDYAHTIQLNVAYLFAVKK